MPQSQPETATAETSPQLIEQPACARYVEIFKAFRKSAYHGRQHSARFFATALLIHNKARLTAAFTSHARADKRPAEFKRLSR